MPPPLASYVVFENSGATLFAFTSLILLSVGALLNAATTGFSASAASCDFFLVTGPLLASLATDESLGRFV